jgi:hypothetical protein
VDLEEADRIQDLDSREPSDFMLGADDDSYRAEDTHVFDPGTLPPTDTAGGARTGIVFSEFSHVMVDSNAYTVEWNGFEYAGYQYADTMSFRLATEFDGGAGPVLAARRELPAGTDLTGSDVLIAKLDATGPLEQIILGGHSGEVYVLDGELNEFLDHDNDPATMEPFAIGLRGGAAVAWNLPPAAGDLDHDGENEIVLTGPAGIYAFKADGSPVRDIEAGSFGLYYEKLNAVSLPAVLLPEDYPASDTDGRVVVCVVEEDETAAARLQFFSGPDATARPAIDLGQGRVPSTPVLADEFLLAAVADTGSGNHRLVVMDMTPSAIPEEANRIDIPLAGEPGPFPVTWGVTPDSPAEDPVYFAVVIDELGHGESVYFDGQLRTVRDNIVWDQEISVYSPLSVGGAFVGNGILGRVGDGGHWQDGWPRRPSTAASPVEGSGSGSPLVAELAASDHNLDQYIFPTDDGRIFGLGTMGEEEYGWPLGGPARSAGSPALGALGGDTLLDLVAVGAFTAITGTQADDADLETEFVSTVTVWRDVALTDPVWPMGGGGAWRNGNYDAVGWQTMPVVASGTGLVSGSHLCYPSPLLEGPLKVRGQVKSPARARAFIYNLEGEEITSTGWLEVTAVNPFTLDVDLDGVVTGLYLCRLAVESDGESTEYSVIQFAVVR